MNAFIKSTKPILSGSEKAAILLAEIGPLFNSNYDQLFEALHLSTDEIKKIRKAMKRLGRYSPTQVSFENGIEQINREQAVLQEVLEYGTRKGIMTTKKEIVNKTLKDFIPSEVKSLANQNPEDVANVLRSWLKE